MDRIAEKELLRWLNNTRRKPLIIWGARQAGKTWLIRNIFAEKYFKNKFVYVDFRLENAIREYCEKNVNAEEIIRFISLVKNKKIDAATLLIFDEIQECPAIITALKYFCQDFREIPVIATGSMVRIKIQRMQHRRGSDKSEPFLFPVGKINQLTLFPMTFDEYLYNRSKLLYETIRKAYTERTPLEPALHDQAMVLIYEYLLIGGMPEAVETFLETESYFESREVLKDLYDNYLSDMALYQVSPESIVRSRKIFQGIYKELNKESKNFKCAMIEKGARNRDFQNPIEWLILAGIIRQSFQLKEHITFPLMEDNASLYRLFLGDIGMFSYQSGMRPESFLTPDGRNTLSGIFFENFIANELCAKGNQLFYWKGKADAEFEFIVSSSENLFPIDVKKGRGHLNSLDKYRLHNPCPLAIKVSKNNYGYNTERGLLTLPFYMFPFASAEMASGKFTAESFIKNPEHE